MVKKYGDSSKIGLHLPIAQNALSLQRDGAWVGYVPIATTIADGSIDVGQLSLVKTASNTYELHFYKPDGTWICKK